MPADQRTANIAALRKALPDPDSRSCTRWIPGPQKLADVLTKAGGNAILPKVLEGHGWSLKEQDDMREPRQELQQKRKEYESKKTASTVLGPPTSAASGISTPIAAFKSASFVEMLPTSSSIFAASAALATSSSSSSMST